MAEKPTYEELKKRVQELERVESKYRRAEEALRESQQIIEEIVNAIPIRIFWKDKNLVFLGCNALFASDAGFADPKEIIGKDDWQMAWRDQAELYRGDDRQVIESGDSKFLIEEPQTTPKGNTITLLTSKTPLRSSTGEICGVLGTYMDITDRKRAEEALRESEEKYRTLFESSRDAIMTLAPPTWLFTSGNPAAVKLFRVKDEAEFVSLGPGQLSPERQPDDKPSDEKAKEMIETAMRNGSHSFEWTHCRSEGTPFTAEVLLTRMEQRGQGFLQATVRDITDRKQVEEERVKRARLQAVIQTTGAVCHELNQPLQAIMSLVEAARDDLDPATPLQQDLKDIQANVDKMAEITRKLNNITSYQTQDYAKGTHILDLDKSSGA